MLWKNWFIHTVQGFKAWVSPEQLQPVSFSHVLFSSEKKMGHYMNIFHIHTVAERAGYNIKLARKEFG